MHFFLSAMWEEPFEHLSRAKRVLAWKTGWELLVLLSWVWISMLLVGVWPVSILGSPQL